VDIVILAFLTEFFGPGGFPKVNFGATCGGQTSEMNSAGASGLLHCPELASQISQCQSLGKKVLLSLGGALAVSAFPSEGQASEFATTLWNLFGAGTGVDPGLRPFGSVTLDGFDVDNENHSTFGYSAFVTALRSTMNTDKSKTYYISAAPQCPRPDASIPLDAMQAMDFVFIQFYNNAAANCNVGQSGFVDSLRAWSADLSAKGAGPRLYVGAPGCVNCAGTGYLDPTTIASVMADVKSAGLTNFGGSMLWDGSEALANVEGGRDFLEVVKNSLR
jgi:chitinase